MSYTKHTLSIGRNEYEVIVDELAKIAIYYDNKELSGLRYNILHKHITQEQWDMVWTGLYENLSFDCDYKDNEIEARWPY